MKTFQSTNHVASDRLLAVMRDSYHRDNDWAHSVLTQGFHVPRSLATKILKGEVTCLATPLGYEIPTEPSA